MARDQTGRSGVATVTAGAGGGRLRRGELSVVDIAASTMANIGPAFSFFFSFAVIVAASGIASPLTVLVAAVAIALLGNTLAAFSEEMPSTGSFVSFIGRALGPVPGVTAGILIIVGYIVAISGVIAAAGEITHELFRDYLHLNIDWKIWAAVVALVSFGLMVRGVKTSTRAAGFFFLIEMVVLIAVSIILLAKHSGSISLAPFNPGSLTDGAKGLGLAFPLAVFLFLGWENSASLAEETHRPRHNIPRAIFFSVALMAATYLLLSFATIVGFDRNADAIAKVSAAEDIPFLVLAKGVAGVLGFVTLLAGFTSTLGVVIAASNSQSRLLFNSGRERLLPSVIGRVDPRTGTPVVSYALFFGIALILMYAYGATKKSLVVFGDLAGLGTILIVVVYLVANIALPVYVLRHARQGLNPVRHVVLPVLGAAALIYPIYTLVQPGQPAPQKYFPFVALAVVVVALLYSVVLAARDRTVGERIGSIIADH